MNDSVLMGVAHRVGQRLQHLGRFAHGASAALNPRVERSAGDQLFDEIRHPVDVAMVIHLGDVGVVQAGGHLGLAAKTLAHSLAGKTAAQHQLDRHVPAQRQLSRSIDDTDAAIPQYFQQLEARDFDRRRRALVAGLPSSP